MPRLLSIPLVLLLTALALAVSGCGDDEESGSTSSTTATEQTESTATETTPETETATETEPGHDDGGGGITAPSTTSPEDQPGGAGDEIPASSQALITGRRGGFHPTVVRVPPFIAIRVELRSADGVEYELEGGGRKVKAGGEIETASTTFEGLKAGERLLLRGPQGKVTIVANAEPGP